MPGRNRGEAWTAFVNPLQRAVGAMDMTLKLTTRKHDENVSTVTSSVPGVLIERTNAPDQGLYFTMTLRCIEDGVGGDRFRMSTMKYDYELLDRDQVIFGWHWHPNSKRAGRIKWPHLHIPPGSNYRKAHVVTGRVSLEDILLFTMDEMDAIPALDNAREIIEETSNRHKRYRSWA